MIFEEKLREDALRDLGSQVVRRQWRDLYRRGSLRERVLRAFARASDAKSDWPRTSYGKSPIGRVVKMGV